MAILKQRNFAQGLNFYYQLDFYGLIHNEEWKNLWQSWNWKNNQLYNFFHNSCVFLLASHSNTEDFPFSDSWDTHFFPFWVQVSSHNSIFQVYSLCFPNSCLFPLCISPHFHSWVVCLLSCGITALPCSHKWCSSKRGYTSVSMVETAQRVRPEDSWDIRYSFNFFEELTYWLPQWLY